MAPCGDLYARLLNYINAFMHSLPSASTFVYCGFLTIPIPGEGELLLLLKECYASRLHNVLVRLIMQSNCDSHLHAFIRVLKNYSMYTVATVPLPNESDRYTLEPNRKLTHSPSLTLLISSSCGSRKDTSIGWSAPFSHTTISIFKQ